MPDLDFQSDAFLTLLTDALRAGPGSPQWQEAVEKLRAEGRGEGDEQLLLLAARERLASGREYRAVRPGPGFDHKVLTAIEAEANRPRRQPWPLATIIAILSIIAVIAVVTGGGYAIWRSLSPARDGTDDLSRVYFTEPIVSTRFTAPPDAPWRLFGPLPLAFDHDAPRGMKPGPLTQPIDGFQGGGVLWDQPIPAGQPVELEVELNLRSPSTDDIVQIFVTDDPTLGGDQGITPHELVWLLRGRSASVVLPSGRVAAEAGAAPEDLRDLTVRIMLNDTSVIVQSGDERLLAGLHELDPNKPRFVGIRLLTKANEPNGTIAVESARLRRPRS